MAVFSSPSAVHFDVFCREVVMVLSTLIGVMNSYKSCLRVTGLLAVALLTCIASTCCYRKLPTTTGLETETFLTRNGIPESLQLLSAESLLVTTGVESPYVSVLDLHDKGKQFSFSGARGGIQVAKLTQDEKCTIIGGYDNDVTVWDLQTGALRHRYSGHTGCVFAVATKPEQDLLVTASRDSTIRYWKMSSEECVLIKPIRMEGVIWDGVFSPDVSHFVSRDRDDNIKVWKLSTYTEVASVKLPPGEIAKMAIHPTKTLFCIGTCSGEIHLWHDLSLQDAVILSRKSRHVYSLAFSSDGNSLAVGSTNFEGTEGEVAIWDLQSKQVQRVWRTGQHGYISSLLFYNHDKMLITGGGGDGSIKLWNISSIPQEKKDGNDQ
jgi:WD40 repeat protein